MISNTLNNVMKIVKITFLGFFIFVSTNVYSSGDVAVQDLTVDSITPVTTIADDELSTPTLSSTKLSNAELSNPMSSSYLIQLILGLVIVILCVVALAWVAKKVNKFHSSSDDSIKIISGISVGTREKIVLLQVGEEQLLVGVSPGNINKLHALNTPIINADANPIDKGFANKFKNIMADASASTINHKKNNK